MEGMLIDVSFSFYAPYIIRPFKVEKAHQICRHPALCRVKVDVKLWSSLSSCVEFALALLLDRTP
jgi:hypothetical protein